MKINIKGFYFITCAQLSLKKNISDVQAALAAGVKIIQYRSKNLNDQQMFAEALKIKKLCHEVIFIVNNRVDLAQATEADGVHLGQDDLPIEKARKILGKNKIIGMSTHSLEQAQEAQNRGADYIGIGPVFPTQAKPDIKNIGINVLRNVRQRISVPIVAIGGIDLNNAQAVIDTEVDMLCAISALQKQNKLTANILKFQKLFELKKVSKI
ncbi:MAG: thiamine phosphate synthase [Candidatus Omnitrophota bacterium]